jgi:glycosyltransferase involved in cell wall biosynthesis
MKILLIDKNLVDSSNYRKWQLLSKKPDVELVAVTPDRWVENYRPLRPPLEKNFGFPVISLKVFWPGYENRGFYIWGLGSVIRKTSPDVIIAFEEPYSLFALQVWIAAKRCGSHTKIVLHTWDNLSRGVMYPYRPKQFYRMVEQWVMPRIDMLLTANQEAAEWRAQTFMTEVHKVYFGIDLAVFGNEKKEEDLSQNKSDIFMVGYVGRMVIRKGVDTLIDALSQTSQSVHLLLVGSGPDQEYLLNKIKLLGLCDRVTFHPSVPSKEIHNYFSKMDVLVLPSRTTPLWKEQYGRVLVEAMASSIPIIGSSSGAIPDVIGNAGLIFPEGDVKELALCIERLKNDDALRIKNIYAGKERTKKFSAEQFADTVYNLLLNMDNLSNNQKKVLNTQ